MGVCLFAILGAGGSRRYCRKEDDSSRIGGYRTIILPDPLGSIDPWSPHSSVFSLSLSDIYHITCHRSIAQSESVKVDIACATICLSTYSSLASVAPFFFFLDTTSSDTTAHTRPLSDLARTDRPSLFPRNPKVSYKRNPLPLSSASALFHSSILHNRTAVDCCLIMVDV